MLIRRVFDCVFDYQWLEHEADAEGFTVCVVIDVHAEYSVAESHHRCLLCREQSSGRPATNGDHPGCLQYAQRLIERSERNAESLTEFVFGAESGTGFELFDDFCELISRGFSARLRGDAFELIELDGDRYAAMNHDVFVATAPFGSRQAGG